jgi:hypothetical protein
MMPAWEIDAIKRARATREAGDREFLQIPLIEQRLVFEICPVCHGNGCKNCNGVGSVPVK